VQDHFRSVWKTPRLDRHREHFSSPTWPRSDSVHPSKPWTTPTNHWHCSDFRSRVHQVSAWKTWPTSLWPCCKHVLSQRQQVRSQETTPTSHWHCSSVVSQMHQASSWKTWPTCLWPSCSFPTQMPRERRTDRHRAPSSSRCLGKIQDCWMDRQATCVESRACHHPTYSARKASVQERHVQLQWLHHQIAHDEMLSDHHPESVSSRAVSRAH
jgi:hypothetical protein